MNAVTIQTRLPLPPAAGVTAQQWRVLTEAIFPSAKTAEAICLALDYCRARRLDVFKRPVHIVPMWNSTLGGEVETVWPSINELQTTAGRTGKWAGMDAPEWGPLITRKFEGTVVGKRGEERQVKAEVTFPEWCSVTVYRLINGERYAFNEPVFWLEAYARQGRTEVPNEMWRKRPRGQLHKNAKAASLRAAFPEDIGSDYAAEEMEGRETDAGGVVIDADPGSVTDMTSRPEVKEPASPQYPYATITGERLFGTGPEWIGQWRTTIDAGHAGKAYPANTDQIVAVAEFDPQAAAEVRQMITEALEGLSLPA